MKKWLFNPFISIAGWQALLAGLVIMFIVSVISYHSQTHFDGTIDAHFGLPNSVRFPYPIYVYEQLNAWLCAVVLFYIGGLILSRSKIRLIDVAGTLALARAPVFFAAVIGFLPMLHQFPSAKNLLSVLIWGIILLLLFIWMIVLMYNAFRISCNLKGSTAIWGFAVCLIFAEVFSKIIIQQIYHHFVSK